MGQRKQHHPDLCDERIAKNDMCVKNLAKQITENGIKTIAYAAHE